MTSRERACQIDISLVRQWAKEAGEMALARFRHVEAHHKAGGELVTQADEEIERFLVERLRRTYPAHLVIGEEMGAHGRGSDCLWAIDPIDGTRAFVSGLPVWGVSIGLLEKGLPACGVFHLPFLGDTYYADVDGDAFWNDRPLVELTSSTWDANTLLCVPANAHRAYEITFQGVTRAMGSTAANILYVARGSAVGALIGPVHVWDLAAAWAMLERVGGEIRYLSGRPVDLFDLLDGRPAPESMLAAGPKDLERLLSEVQVKGV